MHQGKTTHRPHYITINNNNKTNQKQTMTTTAMTEAVMDMVGMTGNPAQEDRWGHTLQPEVTGYIRFMVQNIGGIDLTLSGLILN